MTTSRRAPLRSAATAALGLLVLVGCAQPAALEPTEQAAVPEASVAEEPAVYDPEAINSMIRELPASVAWDDVYAHINTIDTLARLGPGIALEAELSPTVNEEMAQITIDAYTQAMGIWTFFGMEDVRAVWSLMSEDDYDWWYQRVIDIEGDNPALDVWNKEANRMGHCYPDAWSFCGYGNPQQSSGITFQYNIIGSSYQGEPNANTVAHEAVHFYHDSLSQNYDAFMPCWFVEGQATLLGNAISGQGEQGMLPYDTDSLNRFGRPLPGDASWSIAQWEQLLDGFLYDDSEKQRCKDEEINYTFGAVVFEYLYGQYSMWDIHLLTLAATESEDWEGALEDVLGLSVDQLHTDIATYAHSIVQP